MRFECDVDVDFNGIVMFVYPKLADLFEGGVQPGQNVLRAFTTTDKGDEVLDKGVALPIMGVDDGTYRLRIFIDEAPCKERREVVFEDEYFYLNVVGGLYVADMAVLWDWEEFTGWTLLPVPTGMYRVSVAGVHLYNEVNDVDYGFDICLQTVSEPFHRTIEPRSDSRLIKIIR
ncbi:hypothetical protein [Pseudomonas eucalypticola]|uniref:Uncharacterized protein n=1 Tax=Pseudomonas eucalypticola TaxID=2599595 RepID=A0A7D5GY09_9PSED|nr:hypothetical protein [Pseudomonas eucalypticola]QKZ02405.1 hypothetical protein HWQ56_00790 [Pseudomonas eucalypticola]